MSTNPRLESLLVTPLHRAVFNVLKDAGFTEGDSERGLHDQPPYGLASILTTALHTYPTEDQLLDTMTWGHGRESWDELRPIARKLLALVDAGASPA